MWTVSYELYVGSGTVHEDFEKMEVNCQYLTDMLDAVKDAAINGFSPITVHMEDD